MIGVMISIKPEWVKKILRGKKIIEVRKTMPRLKTPFKCYIYCTKPSKKFQTICGSMVLNADELYRLPSGEIKHGCSIELMGCDNYTKDNFLNGKVVGEFICDKIAELDYVRYWNNAYGNTIQLTYAEIAKYGKGKPLYGWRISDLKIYDKPKELSEFGLKRAPQSWCYVEVKE